MSRTRTVDKAANTKIDDLNMFTSRTVLVDDSAYKARNFNLSSRDHGMVLNRLRDSRNPSAKRSRLMVHSSRPIDFKAKQKIIQRVQTSLVANETEY